jgi:hypothetical protein
MTFANDENPPTLSYTVNGKITQVTDEAKEGEIAVVAPYTRVVARYSTLATAAGKGTDPNWLGNMPKEGWTVTFTNRRTGNVEVYAIERGSVRPDTELGVITYILTQMEAGT